MSESELWVQFKLVMRSALLKKSQQDARQRGSPRAEVLFSTIRVLVVYRLSAASNQAIPQFTEA